MEIYYSKANHTKDITLRIAVNYFTVYLVKLFATPKEISMKSCIYE
jgi:hypothetical protein